MHKLKIAFNKRFDAFVNKRSKAERKRMKAISFAILKAYVKKKRQDRRETTMALFCGEKLDFLKMRRMFRSLKVFADWQKNWVKVVRANFRLKKAKACFKQIYLSALKNKIKRAKLLQTLNVYFTQIKLFSIETKKLSAYYKSRVY
jgi:hypothetical protein